MRVADNVFKPLYDRDPDQQAPAGGISSNVQDFAKWMIVVLADGTYNGQPMTDRSILQPAITPQIVTYRGESRIRGSAPMARLQCGGERRPPMAHSGAFPLGAGTTFHILPSADVGFVVLTNGAPVGTAEAAAASFMDIAQYGQGTRDWYPYIKPRFTATTSRWATSPARTSGAVISYRKLRVTQRWKSAIFWVWLQRRRSRVN
jgi:CubicO group peptidase (beta-lactamase class C family)